MLCIIKEPQTVEHCALGGGFLFSNLSWLDHLDRNIPNWICGKYDHICRISSFCVLCSINILRNFYSHDKTFLEIISLAHLAWISTSIWRITKENIKWWNSMEFSELNFMWIFYCWRVGYGILIQGDFSKTVSSKLFLLKVTWNKFLKTQINNWTFHTKAFKFV